MSVSWSGVWPPPWPAPHPDTALSFDEVEAAGLDGTLRFIGIDQERNQHDDHSDRPVLWRRRLKLWR